ncbi:MAG TPA: acyltransferase family protein [Tissierellaceae bacterium]|nr:acyltransferase family protein [Tissierellaceae bacterium]
MEKGNRKAYFDNAKFLLMLLVVFGHLLQPFTEEDHWLYDLYLTIYSFHMPAFIFISGYFSKSFTRKEKQVKKSVYKFIIPYIIFQWIYSLYYWLIGRNDSFSLNLLVPNWSLWFLLSMFFWRISLYLFDKLKPGLGISISILGSLLIGYVPFIGRELTLQRTFVFLPFFITGYYFKKSSMESFKKFRWRRWLFLILPIIFLIIRCTPSIDKHVFFGSKPYEDFLGLVELGAVVRLFSLILGFIGVVGFLGIVPEKEYFYTKNGQNTIIVYLLHGFFIQGLRAINFSGCDLHTWAYLGLVFVLVLGSFILTMFLSSDLVTNTYKKIMN